MAKNTLRRGDRGKVSALLSTVFEGLSRVLIHKNTTENDKENKSTIITKLPRNIEKCSNRQNFLQVLKQLL